MNKALNILQEWMEGINTKNVEKLLKLYNDDAVLIPTFSNRLLDNKDKIKDYFEKVGSKESLSIALHENTLISQELQENIFCLNGIYNWRFAIDGELFNFEARFSYIIDLNKEKPIMQHHSSQIPRGI